MPTKSKAKTSKSKSASKAKSVSSKTKLPHVYSYASHYASYSDGSHHIEEVSQLEQQNGKVKLNKYEKKIDGKIINTGKAVKTIKK